MGISNFYEFHVQEGTPANFKAVPDDSTDLVFGIGEHDVKVLLGGTVLKAKIGNLRMDDIISEPDFSRENIFSLRDLRFRKSSIRILR